MKRALEVIGDSEQPIFVHIILLTHHHPYDHVGNVTGDRRASIEEDYLVSLRYVDAQIGTFYDSLKKSGELEDTILAIYGDHDSGITADLATRFGVETPSVLDTVPFVVAGLNGGPRKVSELGSLQDLPVLVLHELGIRPPITFLAISLRSIGDSIILGSLRVHLENGKLMTESAAVDASVLSKLALWRPEDLEGSDEADR